MLILYTMKHHFWVHFTKTSHYEQFGACLVIIMLCLVMHSDPPTVFTGDLIIIRKGIGWSLILIVVKLLHQPDGILAFSFIKCFFLFTLFMKFIYWDLWSSSDIKVMSCHNIFKKFPLLGDYCYHLLKIYRMGFSS